METHTPGTCLPWTAVGVCLPGLRVPLAPGVCTSSPSPSPVPVLWGACVCLCGLATRLACWWRAAVCLHTIGGSRHGAGGPTGEMAAYCLLPPTWRSLAGSLAFGRPSVNLRTEQETEQIVLYEDMDVEMSWAWSPGGVRGQET